MNAAIILEDGFEDIEAIGCKDILSRGGVNVTLFGSKNIITSTYNTKIIVDELINDNINNYDIIILPGGLPGAYNLVNNTKIIDYLRKFNNEGKLIAAICAASIVLKKANILDNKLVAVYPDDKFINILKNNYIKKNIYCDKNIISASGPGQTFNFSFLILEKLNIITKKIKSEMQI